MKSTLFALLLAASCRHADAAATHLFLNIQAGQSMVVTFSLSGPPPSPYNLLGITAGGTGFVGLTTITSEVFDGTVLLGSATREALDPISLRTASNPFTTFVGTPTQLADLSTLNDDGTLLGKLLITPNFSTPGGRIERYSITMQMITQTGESGGTFSGQSQIEIIEAQVVPEPGSLLLASTSLVILFTRRKRRPLPTPGPMAP